MVTLIRGYGIEGSFEPETVRIMVAAFERAWACLQASGAGYSADGYQRAREIIGQYIIRAAMAGSRSERELCDGALLELAQSQLPAGTPSRTAHAIKGRPDGPTGRPIATSQASSSGTHGSSQLPVVSLGGIGSAAGEKAPGKSGMFSESERARS